MVDKAILNLKQQKQTLRFYRKTWVNLLKVSLQLNAFMNILFVGDETKTFKANSVFGTYI